MNEASERPVRDIILIGGSAGAIEALQILLKSLSAPCPAAIFAVVHTSPEGPGFLPTVLSRASGHLALHATDGAPFERGKIYVAPPDRHITLGPDDTIHIRNGPRENGSRPSVDVLFRSASAGGYGARSIAVILSGYLDDGVAGLYALRRRGSVAIVQSPNDALVGEMPTRALDYAGADYVLSASEIGTKLVELVQSGKVVTMKKTTRIRADKQERRAKTQESASAAQPDELIESSPNALVAYPEEGEGTPSAFACPECHGVLWEIKEGGTVRYRCRTGHAYSEATLNEELSHAAEGALWAAMRALEEKAAMARRMSDSATGPVPWRKRLQERAATFATHAQMIRTMILGEPPAVEEPLPVKEQDLSEKDELRDRVG